MNTKAVVHSALVGVFALGFAAANQAFADKHEKEVEKCYGVVEAGKNDCQTSTHACAGQATEDGQRDAWIYLPKGTCDKIVGGTTEPPA